MSLRNPLRPMFLGLLIGFLSVFSFSPASAQESAALPVAKVERLWPWLDAGQREMVDLIAADFFENQLTGEQRQRIFESSADAYRDANGASRDTLRARRREDWKNRVATGMSDATAYDRLSEAQKAPFRRHAIDQLGLAMPAVQDSSTIGREHV